MMPKWSGKTSNYIHELEINFSNECGANCIMCSMPHGCDNVKIMSSHTFNFLYEQLKDIKYDIMQTSGDGETFRNHHYLDFVNVIKELYIDRPLWIYNNFSEFTPDKIDRVLKNKLFARIHTRIDSLIPWIFNKSSGLEFETVIKNIRYFLEINNETPYIILYNNIVDYYKRCKMVIDSRPVRDRFTDQELAEVPNEQKKISDYFKSIAKKPELITVCRINHSLWGERYRDDISHNPYYPCPKINVIKNVCWVYPNGNVGLCPYEDKQSPEFSLGNIKDTHLLDIFYGDKRKKLIEKIDNLENENPFSKYPCISPRLCGFGDGAEVKRTRQ